ncbi:WD40/YVTN repeat-like containing protein [Gracilaria domingensis]|nr:WD40/YVTN repeat-like containing protein [Gracilaria domingensis]
MRRKSSRTWPQSGARTTQRWRRGHLDCQGWSTWSSGGGTIRVDEAARDTSREGNGTVSGITISNSSAEIVVAGEDGSIDIVDIDSRTPIEAFEVVHTLSLDQLTTDGKKLIFGGHDGPVAGIALSEDGKELASASSDGSIRV